jgi:iron complex transport system ATP-binding protein
MNPAVHLQSVSADYSGRSALHHVSASFRAGAVTAVVGPNGAGKTSLFRTMLGLLPSRGVIRILDRDLKSWSAPGLARAMAYLPQGADAHWPVTARRLVALGRIPHRKSFAPPTVEDDAAIEDALLRCEAVAFADRAIDELSAGERARVLLARALATNAAILLADEPAAHLDPAHQLQLMELLRAEARRGTAVIVTLHDLALAARYCDDVVVMQAGQVATQGAPDLALSDEILARVFGIGAVRVVGDAGHAQLVACRPLGFA